MPEKANHSGFDKCNSCASTSDGPGLGPLSTVSHPQVCCLYKVARQGQSAPFPNEGSHKRNDYDGLCEDCPSRRKSQVELQVGPVYQPPPSSSDAPQAGIVALPTGCEAAPEVAGSPSRKRKGIEPRLRTGFKKYTLEWRPPKFKQKLWFGTYSEGEEIDRARDAVNYYLGRNVPYFLPDSPLIYAERPLKGIKFEDLLPSCDQVIDGEFAYLVYARQVKEVIHSVLGKQKKSVQRKYKGKVSQSLQKDASQRLGIYDPIVPSAPVSCPRLEASSQLAAEYPMFQPPPTTSTQEDEEIAALLRSATLIHLDEQLHNQLGEGPFSLYEMFTFPSAIPTSGDGESSTMEENGYLTELWNFPNEDPNFPSR